MFSKQNWKDSVGILEEWSQLTHREFQTHTTLSPLRQVQAPSTKRDIHPGERRRIKWAHDLNKDLRASLPQVQPDSCRNLADQERMGRYIQSTNRKKKKKTCQIRTLYPTKLSFRNGEVKIVPKKQKLKEFTTTRLALQKSQKNSSSGNKRILISKAKTTKIENILVKASI